MKTFATLALSGLALGLSGCIGMSSYGPESLNAGNNLGEAVTNMGAPDTVMGSDNHLVATWRSVTSFTVLGLFSTVDEKSHAVVVDNTGAVIGQGTGMGNGMGIIFGPMTGAFGSAGGPLR